MKSNKRFVNAAVGLALAASMALPYAAGAQGATGTANQPDVAGFCKGVAAMAERVEDKLAAGTQGIAAKRADSDARLDSAKQEREDKIRELRSKEDERRSERLDELKEEADTDAERQALMKFQTDVAAAVAARRAAIDAANSAFRVGLKGLIATRKAAVDTATSTFASEVRAALAKAKSDCASGASPATVRQALMDALTSARDKFQSELQEIAKIGPQVKPLIDTRREAHQDAMNDFSEALDKAKAELKAAFGA